jgi:stress response protein SCP2
VTDLVAGANQPLPDGAVTVSLPGPFDLSALVVGADGKVSGDGDFVFYNQPSAPGVRLRPDAVTVEPRRLRAGAERVVLVASPEADGATFGRLPVPTVTVAAGNGRSLARFVPRGLRTETVVQLVEIYRRPGGWKLRALGQGYADGLGGLARDFGVDVADDGHQAPGRVQAPGRSLVTHRPTGHRASGGGDGAGAVFAEVVRLTNAERGRAGLRALVFDPRLAAAAQAHSEHMAAAGFFAHESPDGRQAWDRVAAAGYQYAKVAENIAAGQPSPAEVVAGWMDSPGHRKNILDSDVTQIGVGRADGGSYGVYWTQVFGRPRDW